jgi:hypothetical protein
MLERAKPFSSSQTAILRGVAKVKSVRTTTACNFCHKIFGSAEPGHSHAGAYYANPDHPDSKVLSFPSMNATTNLPVASA